MKSRVVKELYKLSTGEESGYVKELTETFQIPESRIREKAKSILESILHDYSAFYISTIDKFFQQTLRAFTRDGFVGRIQTGARQQFRTDSRLSI